MSAAAVEHPCDDGEPPALLTEANILRDRLPGYRVEILGGAITAAPPPAPRAAPARCRTRRTAPPSQNLAYAVMSAPNWSTISGVTVGRHCAIAAR